MITDGAKSLEGLRILVTRAAQQADDTVVRLESLGAKVVALPMIEIGEPDSWENFDRAVEKLDQWDWIIFASANAVEAFFARAPQKNAYPKFATIGPKTSDALNQHGQRASFAAPSFIADSFVENFPVAPNLKILWPKTNVGRTLIRDELTKKGAHIEIVHCYKTSLPGDSARVGAELKQLLLNRAIDVIVLASSQTAKNMAHIMSASGLSGDQLEHVRIIAIGPETAKAAIAHLGKCDLEPDRFTIEGVIARLGSSRA